MTKQINLNRRHLVMAGMAMMLAGCKVIPDSGQQPQTTTSTPSTQSPTNVLPEDQGRHRIALLVPLTGRNSQVGQSLANATTMALLDTNAENLRITTYDTAQGAEGAAQKAIADGNKLILGPLLGSNVQSVVSNARPARVPVVSFSNDTTVAQPGVYLLGHVPAQSIDRSVKYARSQGKSRFAAFVPNGEYGSRALEALKDSVSNHGGTFVTSESYDRGNTSIISAAARLKARGGYDTVLLADNVQMNARGAGTLNNGRTQYIATELWSGESALANSRTLRGSWFAAVSDGRFRQFRDSYRSRFGNPPYRIATIGYDSVLLTLNVANDWRTGTEFPESKLLDQQGFIGIDGVFRFQSNGIAERAMEVREVRNGTIGIVSAAPRSLD